MIVDISVVPKSGRFKIVKKDGKIKIFLKSPPEENKANLELLKELEKLRGKPVKIVSGLKSRHKKIEIDVSEKEWDEFLASI